MKTFPFVLRSWNVKSYESVDPTDSFGHATRVFINKNRVVKIEPQFSNDKYSSWLTDKGRLFFDGVFGKDHSNEQFQKKNSINTPEQWANLFTSISNVFYVSNICNFKHANRYFFVIAFENVGLETLHFMAIISRLNAFIKIRRVDKAAINSDLETEYQLNSCTSQDRLSSSSLGLIVNLNPRYEGSYFNLMLRQRYLKGNFKLFLLGSFVDLTFPVIFLGANVSYLKSVAEGNAVFCRDLASAKNPFYVTNALSSKCGNGKELLNTLKVLKYSNLLTEVWDGSNVLNSSLAETGLYSSFRFVSLQFKDLLFFSAIYIVNTNFNKISNIRVLLESRILRHRFLNHSFNSTLLINQNYVPTPFTSFKFSVFKKYLYLPNSTFFENQESFINTEGCRKVCSKLVIRKNSKNDWQLLRKFVQNFQANLSFNSIKDWKVIFYDTSSFFDFKNFIHFHYQVSQNLSHLNEFAINRNAKFLVYQKTSVFKKMSVKVFNAKLKYWLDNFYTGGKDIFCFNSLTLIHCSTNYKVLSDTF